jgi:hypothetical protein
MNCITTGAAKRHTTSTHHTAPSTTPRARRNRFDAMLSTIELRRLVAAMVD